MLRDEIKPSEDIAAQTYGRTGKKLERWRLALKMRRFEKKHKVTVYASGVSSDTKPITKDENKKNAHANSSGVPKPRKKPSEKGGGEFDFDSLVCKNPQKSKSGYQNLQHVRDDIYTVLVSHRHLGTFPLAVALEKRDKYREAIGLPKAKDSV